MALTQPTAQAAPRTPAAHRLARQLERVVIARVIAPMMSPRMTVMGLGTMLRHVQRVLVAETVYGHGVCRSGTGYRMVVGAELIVSARPIVTTAETVSPESTTKSSLVFQRRASSVTEKNHPETQTCTWRYTRTNSAGPRYCADIRQ